MSAALTLTAKHTVSVEIGGTTIALQTLDASFQSAIENRYAGFLGSSADSHFVFDIDLCQPTESGPADDELHLQMEKGEWLLQRGNFRARWNPESRRGWIRQTYSSYAVDCVLRIVHTLLLARHGGFLVHAASAIRGGKAFLFAGVSGAGKTTISRLAPPDATLLTDEISYVRREANQYLACGTPFAGELARVGENVSAPLETLFLLAQGPANKIEDVDKAQAARELLTNILFFAEDPESVLPVFESACDFVGRVAVKRLTFVPDARVWEMIG